MLASITSSWNFVQHPVKKLFFGSWSDEVVTHRSKSSFSATSAQQLEGTFQLFCIIPFSSLKTAPVPVQSVRLDTPQQSNYKLKIKLRMVANNELTYVLQPLWSSILSYSLTSSWKLFHASVIIVPSASSWPYFFCVSSNAPLTNSRSWV